MIAGARVVAFVPATDVARTRAFFVDVVGLPLLAADDYGCVFDAGGGTLRVAAADEVVAGRGTVAGWTVADIAVAIDELTARGAVFERIPGMDQDDRGVWSAPGGAKVAWFRDPDGSFLSLTEEPGQPS